MGNAHTPIADGSPQRSLDALHTPTPSLAHLMADLYTYRQCTYTYTR